MSDIEPLFDIVQLIHRLSASSHSIEEIADILSLQPTQIRTILSTTNSSPRSDEELRERMLRLAHAAMDEAFHIIKFAPPARKDPMLRAIITASGRSLGKESSNDFADLRLAFDTLFSKMRVENPDAFPDAITLELDNPD